MITDCFVYHDHYNNTASTNTMPSSSTAKRIRILQMIVQEEDEDSDEERSDGMVVLPMSASSTSSQCSLYRLGVVILLSLLVLLSFLDKVPAVVNYPQSQLQSEQSKGWSEVHATTASRNHTEDTPSSAFCPSMQKEAGWHGEHKPILFTKPTFNGRSAMDEASAQSIQSTSIYQNNNNQPPPSSTYTDVMICRVPKVASTTLRKMHNAFYDTSDRLASRDLPSTTLNWTEMRSITRFDHMLGSEGSNNTMSQERFHYLTTSPHVARIMLVRHPVLRILAGYIQIFCEDDGRVCTEQQFQDFPKFVQQPKRPRGLQKTYKGGDCAKFQRAHYAASIDNKIQHWSPPQHCRCGIPDCGIQYEYFHLERMESAQTVVGEYLQQLTPSLESPPWIPPASARSNVHHNQSQTIRFLFGDPIEDESSSSSSAPKYDTSLLDFLNDFTEEEQDVFGYLPLTVENVLQGTVDIVGDD